VEKSARRSTYFELQGIVSNSLQKHVDGEMVCDENEFAIFTNVNPFTQWIREKMKEESNYVELTCEFREYDK